MLFWEFSLFLHHNGECEVYVNGVKVIATKGSVRDIELLPMENTKETVKAGTNVIAIYCKQPGGTRACLELVWTTVRHSRTGGNP